MPIYSGQFSLGGQMMISLEFGTSRTRSKALKYSQYLFSEWTWFINEICGYLSYICMGKRITSMSYVNQSLTPLPGLVDGTLQCSYCSFGESRNMVVTFWFIGGRPVYRVDFDNLPCVQTSLSILFVVDVHIIPIQTLNKIETIFYPASP